jgi:CheY-like chemotaxis protein
VESARSTLDSSAILLVEDDEAGRISTAGLLRRAGYTVHLAPDYRLALSLLESEQSIDLMVTDIVMPDRVNGLALARMARLRRPGIKLLYITGYDIPGLATEALGPLVRKPFADEELLSAVRQLLHPPDSRP